MAARMPSLGEVESIAGSFANAIEFGPLHVPHVDAALEDEILEKATDLVVDDGRDDGGPLSEAAAQALANVVLPATFPDSEMARCTSPHIPGIKTNHHLTDGNAVPQALVRRFDRQRHRPLQLSSV